MNQSVATSADLSIRENPLVRNGMNTLYLERDETSDVTFIVGLEAIRAHRCVLAAFSRKYKAQFYGSMPERGDITVDGVSAAAFKEFLQFFYLDKVKLTMENIDSVLHLAKQSLVDAFVDECIRFLMKMTTVNNVCSSYQLVILHDIKEYQEFCEEGISENSTEVFKTGDFLVCDRNVFLRILKLDSLCCNEAEVFDACIAWARAACERKGLDATNASNLRAELGDAVLEIRFASMTHEEFATRHYFHSGFFSLEESNEIFYMIGNVKDFRPQIFNQTPRKIFSQTTRNRKLLKCNLEYCKIDRKYDDDCFIAIHLDKNCFIDLPFECRKPITLNGFIVKTRNFTNDIVIDLLLGGNRIRQNIRKLAIESINDTQIIFEEPIKVRSGEQYSIELLSQSKTYTKHYFKLSNDTETDGLFIFPYFCVSTTEHMFKCLLFDQLDES